METLSDDKSELDALDFGSLVHEVLQDMGADKELWACPDAGLLGEKLADRADGIAAARYGKIIPPAALIALSSARARLCSSSASTSRNASTMSGSNCVPRQRPSSVRHSG